MNVDSLLHDKFSNREKTHKYTKISIFRKVGSDVECQNAIIHSIHGCHQNVHELVSLENKAFISEHLSDYCHLGFERKSPPSPVFEKCTSRSDSR